MRIGCVRFFHHECLMSAHGMVRPRNQASNLRPNQKPCCEPELYNFRTPYAPFFRSCCHSHFTQEPFLPLLMGAKSLNAVAWRGMIGDPMAQVVLKDSKPEIWHGSCGTAIFSEAIIRRTYILFQRNYIITLTVAWLKKQSNNFRSM